jgi:hypothetical protein
VPRPHAACVKVSFATDYLVDHQSSAS